MKLQIVTDNKQEISGFLSIPVDSRQDIKNVVHNSCTEILAINVLDKMEYADALDFFTALLQRVRLGGSISIGGVHLISLGQNILNELVDSETASKIVSEIKSIIDTRIITNILESNNFTIEYLLLLNQNFYELKATRIAS